MAGIMYPPIFAALFYFRKKRAGMAYTKNNILVQAAQAMLAQANQVPQGILQLLQ